MKGSWFKYEDKWYNLDTAISIEVLHDEKDERLDMIVTWPGERFGLGWNYIRVPSTSTALLFEGVKEYLRVRGIGQID